MFTQNTTYCSHKTQRVVHTKHNVLFTQNTKCCSHKTQRVVHTKHNVFTQNTTCCSHKTHRVHTKPKHIQFDEEMLKAMSSATHIEYSYSKTNQMHQSIKFILFSNDTLHVSDGLSVHHQQFKTVHTATKQILASRQQYLSDKCLLLYVQS